MKHSLLFLLVLLVQVSSNAQQPPWKSPLKIAWSSDGKTFGNAEIFQDSSGVPCVIRWKGDTLIAAFQWFRSPQNTPTWDRVAVKFSYDAGQSWTPPTPIVVNGLPANFQRPFDPTLTLIAGDSLRLYFSSSNGLPMGGLSEIVNCYSAKSQDGVHYTFEPGARTDQPLKPLIDPAVAFFNNSWHYTAPIGAPQEGAYHYVSPDGLYFSQVANIPSDNQHNWTGNFMLNNATELRFYGSGPLIWYNSSVNGGQWNGFVATNMVGGDPSVLRIAPTNYLMVYVGMPYTTGLADRPSLLNQGIVFPNPAENVLHVLTGEKVAEYDFSIYNTVGALVLHGHTTANSIAIAGLPGGAYLLQLSKGNEHRVLRFLKN